MKRLLTIFLLLAATFCATAQTSGKKVAVENVLIDGVSHFSEGDIAGAKAFFSAILKEDPANDAASYYLGMCLSAENKPVDALRLVESAVALDTSNLWYREAQAALLGEVGRVGEAAGIYESLYLRAPKKYSNPYVLTVLGDKNLNACKDSLALVYYERALDFDPEYIPAVLGKSEVYRLRGNLPQFFVCMDIFARDADVSATAKAKYLESLLQHVDPRTYRTWAAQLDTLVDVSVRVSPKDSSMLKLAGQWYYSTGRREKGVSMFDRWMEAYPQDIGARLIHVQILSEEQKWQEVIDECTEALTFCEPKYKVTLYSIIGDTWHQAGDAVRAYKAYDKALKLDPVCVPVLNNYAYYLSLEDRRLRKAEAMSAVTIEKEPENPTYLDTYAWILHLLGKDQEAKVHFKKAIVYGGSDSAVILEHYAEVLEALGEKDVASYYRGQAERKKK